VSDGLIWILAGIGLLGLEVLAPGAFMMWLGIAAIGAGLVELAVNVGFAWQVVIFGVLAAISLGIGLRLRRKPPPPKVNTRGAGLIGRTAVALSFRGHEGRVRIGDSDWAARLPGGVEPPAPGTVLRVVDVDGTVAIVRPLT